MKLGTIFAAFASALTFFSTRGEQIENLKIQVADLKKINEDQATNIQTLHTALENEDLDDKAQQAALDQSKLDLAASQEALAAKQKELDDLLAEIDEGNAKAAELISKVNENQAIPIQVGENGGVVHDEEHPANNAEATDSSAPVETGSGDAGNTGGSAAEASPGSTAGSGSAASESTGTGGGVEETAQAQS